MFTTDSNSSTLFIIKFAWGHMVVRGFRKLAFLGPAFIYHNKLQSYEYQTEIAPIEFIL